MKRNKGLLMLGMLGALAASPALAASVPAMGFDSVNIDFTNGQWSLGWQFTADSNVSVTHLGFYDDLQNDLTERHEVGLYAMDGTLLASTIVAPGDALTGFFRYAAITPVGLSAGTDYIVAATTGSENYTWDPNNFATDSRISFVADRFRSSGSLVFPDEGSSGVTGWFGANFMIDGVNAVPAPGAALLGIVGLAFLKRRRAC